MEKLWISDKLELRYSPTGWPDIKPFPTHLKGDPMQLKERWNKEFAKAKAESILVDDLRIKMVVMKDAKRDTFVEYPGEMEVVTQWLSDIGWVDCEIGNYLNVSLRQVARLKPINSAHGFTEGSDPGVGQYYDKAHGLEPILIGAGPPEIASIKARILEAFRRKADDPNSLCATDVLEEVLDELGIK